MGYLAQDPTFEPGATILTAAASGRPELMEAIGEYHAVSETLARLFQRAGLRPNVGGTTSTAWRRC